MGFMTETRGRWIDLTTAAGVVGCHPITLRRHVRAGTIEATRGAGGAYFLRRSDVTRLARKPPRRGRPKARRRRITDEVLAGAWAWVDACLMHSARERAYVREVATDPERDLPTYRLALAHGLAAEGISIAQSARVLGVSERHVRRLLWRVLEWGLGPLYYRRLERSARIKKEQEARTLVDRISATLVGSGVRSHIARQYSVLVPYRPSRPGRIRPEPSAATIAHLQAAGLNAEEIEAVLIVGLSAEELNELLLRGT
jgi:hypothetical protein